MENNRPYFKLAPGVWGMKILFVNVYMISSDSHWVLVDTGLIGSASRIRRMANDLFKGKAPSAILLTHGHFDHRGAIFSLLKDWQVPVFAHRLELPYLTGKSSYPPPDPTVGGGLMSLLSFLYPKRPIDLGDHIQPLPGDGSVPFLPGWEVIHVPGHAPGQVAFFRRSDRLLIAADAFVTTKQESMVATLTGQPVLSGPPKYFTYDWDAAKQSVIRLRDLLLNKAGTGHGQPMSGEPLREGLQGLVVHFDEVARPHHGRYVADPARADETGVIYVPPRRSWLFTAALTGLAALITIGWIKLRKM